MRAEPLPMFPLGNVLVPGMVLPLHVFEPRYRSLVRDCLAAGGEFGVVLIERGSEVGGGDVRTDIGTRARIVDAAELPDGRWAVVAVGVQRLRVDRWLDDDPYPRAEVVDWDDVDGPSGLEPEVTDVAARLRRVLARRVELGRPAAEATVELADDPVLASFQLVALSPVGPLDQQRLLAVPGAGARLRSVAALLAEEEELLEVQLRLDDDGTGDWDP